jgi:hypothetical protein
MAHSWDDLDTLLKWNIRREPTLPARRVFSHTKAGTNHWFVDARRGTRAPGNKDLLVTIIGPDGALETVESLKQLVEDIAAKAETNREWMKTVFLPALIKTVALGEDPEQALVPAEPSLPGYPPIILLVTLQVIALTEHRKYGRAEPFGGKYLMVRVCGGLVWGVWSAADITYGALMQDTVAVLRAQTGIREPTLGLILAHSQPSGTLQLTSTQLEALAL